MKLLQQSVKVLCVGAGIILENRVIIIIVVLFQYTLLEDFIECNLLAAQALFL